MNIVKVEWDARNNHCAEITEEGWENYILLGNPHSPLLDESVKVVYPPSELSKKGFGNRSYTIKERIVFPECPLCYENNSCACVTLVESALLHVIHCQTKKQFFFTKVRK